MIPFNMDATYQRTDRECPECEGAMYRNEDELFCGDCYLSPAKHSSRNDHVGEWERFWKRREEYSGFTGPERVKMVGGFLGPWIYSEDSIEDYF